MKFSTTVTLSALLLFALPSAGQMLPTPTNPEPPVLADMRPETPALTELFRQSPVPLPPPSPPDLLRPDAPEDRYRAAIKALGAQRHQFVHCELQNGKVFTGLIRSADRNGFTLQTDALAGPYVRYKDLAGQPRPVPAVGTRIKLGAEWTGIGALIAVAVPLLILFSPLVYLSRWQC